MAKMMGPRFKQCRRLGLNVCGHPKAMDRAGRGTSRADKKLSPYGLQLLEKQRLRAYYGVLEKQFRNYVKKAEKSKESTGVALIQMLECRLDNVVYRLGYGASRNEARQLVTHGHFLVNGKKVDIPSYKVSVNDVISVCEKSRGTEKFKTFVENPKTLPKWLEANVENYEGKVVAVPAREDIDVPVNETLIVELYSK